MEHESFENRAIAALMNELFVNIKVDREERPDLDSLYMTAVQAMTGHGGWPLNVFLTPDGAPFYGGTYLPPDDRMGMPGFPKVLEAVAEAYRERREDVVENAEQMRELPRAGRRRQRQRPAIPRTDVLDEAVRRASPVTSTARTAGSAARRSFRSPRCSSSCSAQRTTRDERPARRGWSR